MPDKFTATGYTTVNLVVNMKQFVDSSLKYQRAFEALRGTRTFTRIIQHDWHERLLSSPYFTPSFRTQDINGEPHMTIDETGFVMGLFRSNVLSEYSAMEYRLNKDAIIYDDLLSDNFQMRKLFAPIWKRWDMYIRPSTAGLFVIRLVRTYERTREVQYIAKDVIDLQQSFDLSGAYEQYDKIAADVTLTDAERRARTASVDQLLEWLRVDIDHPPRLGYIPVQWQLALEICHRFIEAIGYEIQTHRENNGKIQLCQSLDGDTTQQNDAYVIYHLDELFTKFNPEQAHTVQKNYWRISPREIKAPAAELSEGMAWAMGETRQIIVNLLEGALLDKQRDRPIQPGEIRRYFPLHDRDVIEGVFKKELATWDDELCLLTARSAVIIPSYRTRNDMLYISTLPATSTTSVEYLNYWIAFERMVEFVIEIRVLAQILERLSSRIMQEFADTLRDLRSDMLRRELRIDRARLIGLVEESANLVRLVGMAQSLSNPHVWSRAEYGVSKADALLQEMRIDRLLTHIERNVSSLSGLVDHIDELYLAELSEGNNRRANYMSVVLAAVSLSIIIFSLPSFWQDSRELNTGILNDVILSQLVPIVTQIGTILGPILMLFSLAIVVGGTLVWSARQLFRLRLAVARLIRRREPDIDERW
jgi:hypothetical protein